MMPVTTVRLGRLPVRKVQKDCETIRACTNVSISETFHCWSKENRRGLNVSDLTTLNPRDSWIAKIQGLDERTNILGMARNFWQLSGRKRRFKIAAANRQCIFMKQSIPFLF